MKRLLPHVMRSGASIDASSFDSRLSFLVGFRTYFCRNHEQALQQTATYDVRYMWRQIRALVVYMRAAAKWYEHDICAVFAII